MPETKQAQRVLMKGKKLLGVEQVQSVVIHDAETWEDHVEELYHQCKLMKEPVIPVVCKRLTEIALEQEPTKAEAARVLGVSRTSVYHFERSRCSLVKWRKP